MPEGPEKDEKTEEATGKRISEARDDGQVAFSSEVMSATTLVAGLIAFAFAGPHLAEVTGASVAGGLLRVGDLARADLDAHDFAALLSATIRGVLPAMLSLVLPVVGLAALVGFAQVGGWKLSPKAIMPKWSKIDPMAGAKRMVGPKGWMRTMLAFLKLTVLSLAVLLSTWEDIGRVSNLAGGDIGPVMVAVGVLIRRAAITGVLAVVALALLDFWFQRAQFSKDMRMSKKEIKDEQKSSDGDPAVKARIRQVQRETAGRRMMEDVPDATVVVTNPTHFAVALKYDAEGAGAPRIVAKGVDSLAQRIKEVAREAGVLVYEDPPLARALHRGCEIGDEVPEDLFQAVAGVLAYVYRVQGGTPVPA